MLVQRKRSPTLTKKPWWYQAGSFVLILLALIAGLFHSTPFLIVLLLALALLFSCVSFYFAKKEGDALLRWINEQLIDPQRQAEQQSWQRLVALSKSQQALHHLCSEIRQEIRSSSRKDDGEHTSQREVCVSARNDGNIVERERDDSTKRGVFLRT